MARVVSSWLRGSVPVTAPTVPGQPVTVQVRLPGDRERVRQFACISLLDLLRRTLSSYAPLERIL